MSETLDLYSFYDGDRSAKVRWTAAELGIDVEEHRIKGGDHLKPPYTDMNPLGQIPSVRFHDEMFVESTAICRSLVDAISEPRLEVDRGEEGRKTFHYWMGVFCENFEGRLVDAALAKLKIVGPEYFDLHQDVLRRKLAVVAKELPREGYLCGERFTLADICAGYSLLLAVQTKLVPIDDVNPYLGRLRERPGAIQARVFTGLDKSGR
ncbi:MAG: glutathione S-transferase family protein [Deltaproteobacteria bacterium]|nr:glutathione S-transferase family protein [Deltaproteobacteria bacterium]